MVLIVYSLNRLNQGSGLLNCNIYILSMPLEGKFEKYLKLIFEPSHLKLRKKPQVVNLNSHIFLQNSGFVQTFSLSQLSVYNLNIQLQMNCFIENHLSIDLNNFLFPKLSILFISREPIKIIKINHFSTS